MFADTPDGSEDATAFTPEHATPPTVSKKDRPQERVPFTFPSLPHGTDTSPGVTEAATPPSPL